MTFTGEVPESEEEQEEQRRWEPHAFYQYCSVYKLAIILSHTVEP